MPFSHQACCICATSLKKKKDFNLVRWTEQIDLDKVLHKQLLRDILKSKALLIPNKSLWIVMILWLLNIPLRCCCTICPVTPSFSSKHFQSNIDGRSPDQRFAVIRDSAKSVTAFEDTIRLYINHLYSHILPSTAFDHSLSTIVNISQLIISMACFCGAEFWSVKQDPSQCISQLCMVNCYWSIYPKGWSTTVVYNMQGP